MPDADKVPGLGYRHQGVYKQVCEDVYSEEEVAYNELDKLRKDFQDYSDAPIELIQQAATILSQSHGPLLKDLTDWGLIGRKLEKLEQEISQRTSANKRGFTLALEACKDVLHCLRGGSVINNLELAIIKKYMSRVYESNFVACIPRAHHYRQADSRMVETKLREMRPFIEEGLSYFANQVIQSGSVKFLRRHPKNRIIIGLHDSLI